MDIKETMELIDEIISLAEEIVKDSEDGKLTVLEILGNYPNILKVINEGKDYDVIEAELKDLSLDEIQQLITKLITIIRAILKIVANLKK